MHPIAIDRDYDYSYRGARFVCVCVLCGVYMCVSQSAFSWGAGVWCAQCGRPKPSRRQTTSRLCLNLKKFLSLNGSELSDFDIKINQGA